MRSRGAHSEWHFGCVWILGYEGDLRKFDLWWYSYFNVFIRAMTSGEITRETAKNRNPSNW